MNNTHKYAEFNICSGSDSYKLSHHKFYLKTCRALHSYFESRKGATYAKTAFHGLQYQLLKYLVGQIVTQENIEDAAEMCKAHFGSEDRFNRNGWEYILNIHNGKLPLEIRAVPEGTRVPTGNVLMTVENTDHSPEVAWLTNYVETMLTHVWYSSNVLTISSEVYRLCREALERTAEDIDFAKKHILPFQFHNFGFRGTESNESACVGGMSHLCSGFRGTDVTVALRHARAWYGATSYEGIGFSVDATEHSIMTSLGEAGEERVFDHVLAQTPEGVLSVVADSYNIDRFVNSYVRARKDKILARKPNALGVARFVVRPDSLRYKLDTPTKQMVWLSESMWNIFGGKVNNLNKRVLDPRVGILWGDGIELKDVKTIIDAVELAGFSTEHLLFGMGGGLLQKHDRDTQCSAFKCSAQLQGDTWVDIKKKPLDPSKVSKGGRLALVMDATGQFKTVTREDSPLFNDVMTLVYRNGEMIKTYTIEEIRANAAK
jgi:nicotinamide phosphoribosyltransferase